MLCLSIYLLSSEGLDIAEVDLIVFFEAVASPIRLIQRMGRTGRRKAGRVVMLVSDGAEQEKLFAGHKSTHNMFRMLRDASATLHLCSDSPRMIPLQFRLPERSIEDLDVPEEFHLSQIGGNGVIQHKKKLKEIEKAKAKELSETNAKKSKKVTLVHFISSSVFIALFQFDGPGRFFDDNSSYS
jgi:superfamily II DNA/RNA helicase